MTQTLGSAIRAARLGYGWVPQVGAYCRVSDVGESAFRLEFCPPADLPGRADQGEHRAWWASEPLSRGQMQADLAGCLRRALGVRVKRLKVPVCVHVDMDGRPLAEEEMRR